MLLRRVIEHVKAQNWTAVGLDFVIVVVGVFIGIQVSNWNDGRRIENLEQSYLTRLADDLRDSIEIFESEVEFADASRREIEGFLEALKNPATSDEALVRHANSYQTDGAFFSTFNPTITTFNDLQSTGNLDIIRNDKLREALVELHAKYLIDNEAFEINLDWVLAVDSEIYMQIDLLRFDHRTSAYFPTQNIADTAQYIRAHQDTLTRHAAIHFWFKDRAVEIIRDATVQTKAVLNQIEEAG